MYKLYNTVYLKIKDDWNLYHLLLLCLFNIAEAGGEVVGQVNVFQPRDDRFESYTLAVTMFPHMKPVLVGSKSD